jgi:N-sulfoglucosamine sulfohydrolase
MSISTKARRRCTVRHDIDDRFKPHGPGRSGKVRIGAGFMVIAMLFLVDIFFSGCSRAAVLPENNGRDKNRDQDRPNILWLVSEDNSPETIGVYGNPAAYTPHIDRLASGGIVFRHAFSHSPVCAVARSTLLSGMHSPSTGMHQMRSRIVQPPEIEALFYPNLLRKAGYYTTNNSKTDYNLPAPHRRFWDESSDDAHYKNRAEGQPFFAVFNNHDPHESSMFLDVMANDPGADPDLVELPPYHPDIPKIRRSWAHYFDMNTLMDTWVGGKLAELEELGLAENTIVFYYGDHGGVLPRSKRFLYHTGTAVPLVVYFPEKWQHLAPSEPGSWSDELVGFVDFPPTLLSLIGEPIPEQYQGRAFLGPQAKVSKSGIDPEPEIDPVFLYRDRMVQQYDMQRGVFDGEYRYIRNFMPHRPNGQYIHFPFRMQAMQAWYAHWASGKATPEQSLFWLPQPSEELYHTASDPWEVHNLAGDPAYAEKLGELREATRRYKLNYRDAGFIPDDMHQALTGGMTLYEYIRSDAYPLDYLVDLAEKATSRNPEYLPELLWAMQEDYAPARFWGALGCLVLGYDAMAARSGLTFLLDDEFASVRVMAAEALGRMGDMDLAIAALSDVLDSELESELLYAVNALASLDVPEKYHGVLLNKLRPIAYDEERVIRGSFEYSRRTATYLVLKWTEDTYPPIY